MTDTVQIDEEKLTAFEKLSTVKSENMLEHKSTTTMIVTQNRHGRSIPQATRRSQRARKSTTMTIQGHTVLTKNNYVVKGLCYVHGAHGADQPKEPKKKKRKKDSNAKPSVLSGKQQIQKKLVEDRIEHNDVVKKRMKLDQIHRHEFMKKKKQILEPFLEPKIKVTLSKGSRQTNEKNTSNGEDIHLPSQPSSVITTLRDYQFLGLEWMLGMQKQGLPMILGDEMGLGKTIQSISLIAHLKEQGYTGPSLVLCPLSVVYSWCAEIEKHAPTLRSYRWHSSDRNERETQQHHLLRNILDYDIVVTTYDMIKNPQVAQIIKCVFFNIVVLDEGHIIKDMSTQISQSVRKIHAQTKLILTGTPLQNNLVELYAILNFLYPAYFTKDDYFAKAFDISKNCIDSEMLLKANKVLSLFMLRRLKEQVEKLMPKKIETKILCPLSSTQIFWYKGLIMKDIDSIIRLTDGKSIDAKSGFKYQVLRNLVMQLRKCCIHPFLFDGAEPDIDSTSLEEIIASSGKLAVLDKLLMSLFANKNRTVIFSQFTRMLDILEDYCIMRGWNYCRFDGGTARAKRNYLINKFNARDSDVFIFLMSTRSGGLGINLQTADTCILYDSDWNPQPDLQAMARVHRIGQKKVVHVYRLVSHGTVEERVLERAEKKLYLDQIVNSGASDGVNNEDNVGLTTAELLSTLRFGSNAVFSSTNELPNDNDIEHMTDRKRSENTSKGLLQGGTSKTAKDFEKDKALTSTTTLNGVDFKAIRESQGQDKKKKIQSITDLKKEWKTLNEGRGKREKTSRVLTVKVDGHKAVNILRTNNYELEHGEPSVFKHETKKTEGMSNPTNKGKGRQIKNQDFCQVCGEGGKLICCPICPISMHEKCCGMKAVHFGSCSHHQCSVCAKNISGAGGVLFPCESCPNAYCEDCLPKKGVTFLEQDVPRYAKLGFEIPHRYVYIHCSDVCKKIAIDEFNWKAPTRQNKECPEAIDVSYAFGANALSVKDLATRRMNRIAIDEINSHQVIGDVVSDDKDQSGTMNKIAIDQMDPPPVIEVVDSDDNNQAPPVIEVVDSDDNNQVRTKNKDAIDQMDSHPVIEILD